MVVGYKEAAKMPTATEENREPIKHVGNKARINVETNQNDLIVIGNSCKIFVDHNRGSVKIVGDSCVVTVLRNSGIIRYVGNSGVITVGEESPSNDVKYTGNSGVLKYCDRDTMERTRSEKIAKKVRRSRKDSIKKNSRQYHSDSELSAASIIDGCNSFLSKLAVDLDYCSMDCLITGDATMVRHGISVVNGNVIINNMSARC